VGKYEPLAHYLRDREDDSWDARFSEVERVLGFELPRSAHEYPAWWANQDGCHSQTKGWRGAGWETERVNLANKRVRFVRKRPKAKDRPIISSYPTGSKPGAGIDALVSDAMEVSGIADRDEAIAVALRAFIAREAGKQLIALGGTMPDAWAPPRRRFD
jgi:hypothetical protein